MYEYYGADYGFRCSRVGWSFKMTPLPRLLFVVNGMKHDTVLKSRYFLIYLLHSVVHSDHCSMQEQQGRLVVESAVCVCEILREIQLRMHAYK